MLPQLQKVPSNQGERRRGEPPLTTRVSLCCDFSAAWNASQRPGAPSPSDCTDVTNS